MSKTVEQLVNKAIELQREAKVNGKEMETVKESLRAQAKKKSKDGGSVEWQGEGGAVKVSFGTSSSVTASAEEIEKALKDDIGTLFTIDRTPRVSFAKTFRGALGSATAAVKRKVKKLFKTSPATPAVTITLAKE